VANQPNVLGVTSVSVHILVEVRKVFEVDRPAHPDQFLDNFEEFGVPLLVLVLVLAAAEHEHHADFLGNASHLQFVDVRVAIAVGDVGDRAEVLLELLNRFKQSRSIQHIRLLQESQVRHQMVLAELRSPLRQSLKSVPHIQILSQDLANLA